MAVAPIVRCHFKFFNKRRRLKQSISRGLGSNLTQYRLFVLNGQTPASFIVYFWCFQTNIITIFTTNIREKSPSSIRCRDLNT